MRLRTVLWLLLLLCLGVAAPAFGAPNPFRLETAPTTVSTAGAGTARITLVVPEGFHVYRDMMSVAVLDAGGLTLGAVSYPKGLAVPDPANPDATREEYPYDVILEVPVTAPKAAGTYVAQLSVTYQGCKKSLCYMPVTETVMLSVTVPAGGAAPVKGEIIAPGQDKVALVSTAGGGAPATAVAGHATLYAGVRPAPLTVDLSGVPDSAHVKTLDPQGKPHPVEVWLIADQTAVKPGGSLRLGVLLAQQEGWHTYWRSPGDIGLPTQIAWTAPSGATVGPVAFPVPERFQADTLVSYGYDDQVLFFTEIKLPDSLSGAAAFTAEASWLVCQTSCIPGSASLKLELPVGDPAPSATAPLFDHYAAQHPADLLTVKSFAVESALSVSALQAEKPFKAAFLIQPIGEGADLSVGPGTWPVFTPIVEGAWMVLSTQATPQAGGGLLVVIEGQAFTPEGALPTTDAVGGLVQVKVGDRYERAEVRLPLPWAEATAAVTPSTSPLFAAAGPAAAAPTEVAATPVAPAEAPPSMGYMMLLAFLGGMLLNIMPCVLPVLTLKLYSLVEQGGISDRDRMKAGVGYTAGILASFLALAAVVVVLRETLGAQVGWGFQFQYPGYVAVLATIVFLFGLSLFGVFEVPAFGADAVAGTEQKEGMAGYFLTGVFATLLATPCSAPFLGTGMGFALQLEPLWVMLFFGLAGLGLAAPFLLIAFVPTLYRFLPRPGAWMVAGKQVLGFTLIATTVWLIDVLGAQVGRDGVTGFLAFLTAVGFAAWLFGTFGGLTETRGRQAVVALAGAAVAGLVGWRFLDLEFEEAAPVSTVLQTADLDFAEKIPWQAFTEQRVEELAGKTVFIDFTADWCVTCKVNEKTVLETETVREAMKARGVVPLKGDWTRKDEAITRWLQRYGRAGVPFYLVIPADRTQAPIPLPEVITPGLVVEALTEAEAKG